MQKTYSSYKPLTLQDFENTLNTLSSKSKNNQFVWRCGEKQYKIIDLTQKLALKLISEEEYNVRYQGIILNAYIHPNWDYWSLPQIEAIKYNDAKTNEIFDEYEDEYEDFIKIYIGRK